MLYCLVFAAATAFLHPRTGSGGIRQHPVTCAPRAALRATGNTAVDDDARKSHLSKQTKALLENLPACYVFDASWEDTLVQWCMDADFSDLNDVWGEPPDLDFQADFCKVVAKKKGEFACLMKAFDSEYGSKAAVAALRATGNTAVDDDARKSHLSKQTKALLENLPACDVFDASWEDTLVQWCMDEGFSDLNDVWGEPPHLNFQADFCKVVAKKEGRFARLMKAFDSEYGSPKYGYEWTHLNT